MEKENKYKAMTEQLRLSHSDEDVAGYLRWIITSETSAEHWSKICKEELLKQTMLMVYDNGYPSEAVSKSVILSLPMLIKSRIKKDN